MKDLVEIFRPKLDKLAIKLDAGSTCKFEAPLMKCDLFQALENTEIEAIGSKEMGQNQILIYSENFRR